MKQVQIALLAALVVVLSVIAYELTRLANDFQLGADLRQAIVSARSTPPETPAQRKARIHQEALKMNNMVNDEADVFTESLKLDAKQRPSTPKRKPQ